MPGLTDLNGLFAPAAGETTIALAVSGGADSLALMLLASHWVQGRDRPKVVVYSVDHGLRSEAAAEVRMVVTEAARLGFPVRGLRWDGDKPVTGVQAAARAARYGLMREAMREDGATLLLTAHHLRDQAETVLMRFAHGTGPEGLRGMDVMSTVEGVRVVRPFLAVHPDELRAVVAEHGLTPVEDPSNADEHYERVRWRSALPMLHALGFSLERLGTVARRMGEVSDVLANATDDAEQQIVVPEGQGARLLLADFRSLPPAIATRVLLRTLQRLTLLDRPPSLAAVEAVRDWLGTGVQSARTVHGCLVSVTAEAILIHPEKPRTAALKALSHLTAN